jgi:transcription-repair coupling factor (superfamily II helicase)
VFQSILDYFQRRSNKGRLKQTGKLFLLVVEDVRSMKAMFDLLADMQRNLHSLAAQA